MQIVINGFFDSYVCIYFIESESQKYKEFITNYISVTLHACQNILNNVQILRKII